MRLQAGVKSIAMGGRPNRLPIQGIGGTKGANNYDFGTIQRLATIALQMANAEQIQKWTAATNYSDLPILRSTDSSLNVRDNILKTNLEDGIPAQFVYEAADCRLYYEPSMITNVTEIWRKVANTVWGSGKCIAGSLPQVSETLAARKRKSEEIKQRAKLVGKPLIRKPDIPAVALPTKSPTRGKKVPWA